MASPLGLTTLTTGSTNANNTANSTATASQSQSGQAQGNQQSGYNYNGYDFKKYSSAPNVRNRAKKSIFTGGSTAFTTRFEHSNDTYDVRTNSIIKYCNNPRTPAMKIKAEDFAYLRNLGVYSNNRLIVVRRFPAPVGNDLTVIKASPISTMISWIPDNEKNFMSVSFGEEWTTAKASLKDLLNDVGNDLSSPENRTGGGGKGLGNMLAGGLNALPLPGFMEGVQLRILNKLGYTDNDANSIPSGNPNIIKTAKVRKTLDKDAEGSGLKCKISIDFETEYEQKFIDGVDPTLVYLDVLSTVLRFGTSESKFIINTKLQTQGAAIINKIKAGQWIEAIELFVKAAIEAMKEIAADLISTVVEGAKKVATEASKGDLEATVNAIFDTFLKSAASTIISKYKVRLGGIMSALSGEPSAPWHVTIGNPKKPVFSSGDMLVEEVSVDLGNILSFNDLPSNIKIKFTLTNARPLGAQEIFERFNTGAGRTYAAKPNNFEEKDVKLDKK